MRCKGCIPTPDLITRPFELILFLPIEAALEAMRRPAREANALFHQLEQLRDEVLEAGVAGVELVLGRWPEADRQHVRQLILQHQRELQKGKPPAASRKLFRYLRELLETYGASG